MVKLMVEFYGSEIRLLVETALDTETKGQAGPLRKLRLILQRPYQ